MFCNNSVTWGTIQLNQMFLTRLWRWLTTLDCEMPKSPYTLLMLLTRFAKVMMVTNYTGLVRCQARLILSKCYSPDLPKLWRWRITVDCEVLNLPDTLRVLLIRFASIGLEHRLKIYGFRSIRLCLIVLCLATHTKFLEPSDYCDQLRLHLSHKQFFGVLPHCYDSVQRNES